MDANGWKLTENGWQKVFRFDSFTALTDFLARVGPEADAAHHHPDVRVFKATYLEIHLITHDSGSVTEKDTQLAAVIDRLYHS